MTALLLLAESCVPCGGTGAGRGSAASTTPRRGNRPSFAEAAPPKRASRSTGASAPSCGLSASRSRPESFGERMALERVNDGHVTIVLDT
ncbi:MAG: D-aminoacyl-tRNA deacylase [Thermoleophilia bacterium]|nr:D-aminoacyl-tRNA deacylase [Thermoleophilia bacterium]